MTAPRRNTRPAPAGETKAKGPSLKELLGPEEPEATRNRTVRQEFEDMHAQEVKKKRQQLLTPEGFNARYEELQTNNHLMKAEAVYELVEEEHKQLAGRRKYSNFDSFRQIRKRIIRGLKVDGD